MTLRAMPVIVAGMIGPHRIEGYAIVSADGRIADEEREMPESIRNDADQTFLQSELDQAALIVHGRHSHEGGPRSGRRHRLILTRQVASIESDKSNPHALLWNPAGATFAEAVEAAHPGPGTIAIIGGTDVFGLFLPLYDAFHVTSATNAHIPGGLPLFPEIRAHATAEQILARHGLVAGPRRDLDAGAGIRLTTWERPRAS